MFRNHFGNSRECFVRALHDVVTAGSVDVHIHKSRSGGFIECLNFLRTSGQRHAAARTYRFNDAIAKQDTCIDEFCCGSKCPMNA